MSLPYSMEITRRGKDGQGNRIRDAKMEEVEAMAAKLSACMEGGGEYEDEEMQDEDNPTLQLAEKLAHAMAKNNHWDHAIFTSGAQIMVHGEC